MQVIFSEATMMDSLVAGEGGGPTVDARRRREVRINNQNGGAGMK